METKEGRCLGWIVYINKSRGLGVALLLVVGFQLRLFGVLVVRPSSPLLGSRAVWLRCQYVRAKVGKSLFVTCHVQC